MTSYKSVFCVCSLQENSLGMDGAIFIATALRGNHQLTYIKLVCICVCEPPSVCDRFNLSVSLDCIARVVNVWHFATLGVILKFLHVWECVISIWSVTKGGIFLWCVLTRFICVSVFRVMALGSRGQRWSRMPSELERRSVWWISSVHAHTTILC